MPITANRLSNCWIGQRKRFEVEILGERNAGSAMRSSGQANFVKVVLKPLLFVGIGDHVQHPEPLGIRIVGNPPKEELFANVNLATVSFGDTHSPRNI